MPTLKNPVSLKKLKTYFSFCHVLTGMSNLLRDGTDAGFKNNLYNNKKSPVLHNMFMQIKENGAINTYNVYQLKEDDLDDYLQDLSYYEKKMKYLKDYPRSPIHDNTDKFLDHISLAKKQITAPYHVYPDEGSKHANSLTVVSNHVRLNAALPYMLNLTSTVLCTDENEIRKKAVGIDYYLGFLENSDFAPKTGEQQASLYLQNKRPQYGDVDVMLKSMGRQFRMPQSLPDVPINL